MAGYLCQYCFTNDPTEHDKGCQMARMTDRDPLLVEREKTHGSFEDNAKTWFALWNGYKVQTVWPMNPQQQLAIGMIFVKLARIASTPNEKDHWDDIAGYAKLGSEACE